MQRELNVSGPPGAGKTKQIQRLAVASAIQFGPENLGACTFTRAAATELRLRIGGALHIPPDPATLRKRIPYVGTIHSISWRLLGRPPLISRLDLAEFARGLGANYKMRAEGDYVPGPDEVDALSPQEPSAQMSEVELALVLLSQIRHRYPANPDPALHIHRHLPPALPAGLGAERLLDLMRGYQQFKLDKGLSDFEDFLERGRDETLPVKVLIVDEAQDNSPLLWSCVDGWARQVHTLIIASDPYQSIFRFAGADPVLCRDRKGSWLRLDAAHRFSDKDAQYAKSVLRSGGWDAPEDEVFHSSWKGTGDSSPDGTTFWLARTHSLLIPIRARLLDSGTPFAELRGKAPLAQKSASAYLTSQKWARGEALSAGELHLFVESLPPRVAKLGVPAAIKRLALTPGLMLSPMEVRDHLGLMTPPYLAERLPHHDYYARVWSAHGEQGFKEPPTTMLGTIHCSPPDEEVLTTNSWVPVGELRREDRVVSFADAHYYSTGFEHTRINRKYAGPLLTIETALSKTRVTPNHKVMCYYRPDAESTFVVYLMRTGQWWRIGQTRMQRVDGERTWGLTRRMGNIGADECWVVRVLGSREEAIYEEALLSTKYGIPATGFGQHSSGRDSGRLSAVQWGKIYDDSSLAVQVRAEALLIDNGLFPRLPFYSRKNGHLRSATRMFELHAANLYPALVHVVALEPGKRSVARQDFSVSSEAYFGEVYDLNVEPHNTYFSGGLLVHNSSKGREADVVHLVRSWGILPGREARAAPQGEACVAYVGASRHRKELILEDGFEGIEYNFPKREEPEC